MLNQFLQLTLARKTALITAILTTLACTVIVLASYQGNKQLVHKSAALFGESLIQQLSREASNPLVQNDKLSLQALLNELVNSPMVLHAVIYDVENRPISEAGPQHNKGLSLSASITFQDSIAGYAVITLNSQSLQQQAHSLAWQLIALTVLLAILIYCVSGVPARYICALLNDLTVAAACPPGKKNMHIAYRGDDELHRLAQQIIQGPDKPDTAQPGNSPLAMLSLQVANLMQLQQPLGTAVVMEHIADCYQQLAVICKLYDGHMAVSGPYQFSVYFYPADNENSYPFRALCSGYLIQQWMNASGSPLRLDIGLALKDSVADDELINELAVQEVLALATFAGRCGEGQVVTTDALSDHPSVSSRVCVRDIKGEASLRIIDKLNEPYHDLLIRQLDALNMQRQN